MRCGWPTAGPATGSTPEPPLAGHIRRPEPGLLLAGEAGAHGGGIGHHVQRPADRRGREIHGREPPLQPDTRGGVAEPAPVPPVDPAIVHLVDGDPADHHREAVLAEAAHMGARVARSPALEVESVLGATFRTSGRSREPSRVRRRHSEPPAVSAARRRPPDPGPRERQVASRLPGSGCRAPGTPVSPGRERPLHNKMDGGPEAGRHGSPNRTGHGGGGAEARAGEGGRGRPVALRSPSGYWAGVGERRVRVIPMIASNTLTHIS